MSCPLRLLLTGLVLKLRVGLSRLASDMDRSKHSSEKKEFAMKKVNSPRYLASPLLRLASLPGSQKGHLVLLLRTTLNFHPSQPPVK